MVGLPSRGKSYLCKQLSIYFNDLNYNAQIFNLGDYRRKYEHGDCNYGFFSDPKNRDKYAELALHDIIKIFKENEELEKKNSEIKKTLEAKDKNLKEKLLSENGKNGQEKSENDTNRINCCEELVSIKKMIIFFDATNSTLERREYIRNILPKDKLKKIWIEMLSDDDNKIEEFIRKSKIKNGDYIDKQDEEAIEDFKKRIQVYKEQYQTFEKDEIEDLGKNESYVKITDFGKIINTDHLKKNFKVAEEFLFYLKNEYNKK
jgi:hypothetical protein